MQVPLIIKFGKAKWKFSKNPELKRALETTFMRKTEIKPIVAGDEGRTHDIYLGKANILLNEDKLITHNIN